MDRPTGRHVFYSLEDHFGNNALFSDSGQVDTLHQFSEFCAKCVWSVRRAALFCLIVTGLGSCDAGSDSAPVVTADAAIAQHCGGDGFLTTEMFGALQTRLQWTAAELECEGMPRPNGDGARLRFAGQLGDGQQLAFIIALPGLRRGEMATELATTVTIIEEGSGRFFSTATADICWTDITRLDLIGASASNYLVDGNLYCVAPLTQVNGDSDILIRDLEFRGLLDWDAA